MNRPTFTSRHISKGARQDESVRLRNRLGQFFRDVDDTSRAKAAQRVSQEMGVRVFGDGLEKFLSECSLHELLDSVSHIFDGLPTDEYEPIMGNAMGRYPKAKWLDFAARAFGEENVSYKVLPDASVTFFVDQEFEESRRLAIGGLNDENFEAARQHLQHAMEHLRLPEAGAHAIDATFKALENVYKIVSGETSLKKNDLQAFYEKSLVSTLIDPEKLAARLMLRSFGEWVAACHMYRHADDNAAIATPSRELTVWMVGAGMNHLRWMLEANAKSKK